MLLHGHIALAIPSLHETEPQILVSWCCADEVHLGKYYRANDFWSQILVWRAVAFVNFTRWIGFCMSDLFRKNRFRRLHVLKDETQLPCVRWSTSNRSLFQLMTGITILIRSPTILSWRDSYSSHISATAPKRLCWFAETTMRKLSQPFPNRLHSVSKLTTCCHTFSCQSFFFNMTTALLSSFFFDLLTRLFINLTMCIRALFPNSATTLGLVEQAFWRVPLFTEWVGASAFEVILARPSRHSTTGTFSSGTSDSRWFSRSFCCMIEVGDGFDCVIFHNC